MDMMGILRKIRARSIQPCRCRLCVARLQECRTYNPADADCVLRDCKDAEMDPEVSDILLIY